MFLSFYKLLLCPRTDCLFVRLSIRCVHKCRVLIEDFLPLRVECHARGGPRGAYEDAQVLHCAPGVVVPTEYNSEGQVPSPTPWRLTKDGLLNFKLSMMANPWRLLALLGLYLLYLVLGSAVFSAIEGPEEVERVDQLRSFRHRFLDNHTCVSDASLEELIKEVVRASNRGVSAEKNVTGEPNWSFGQSLFFASTVVTTIGYGHVTPLSRGGKIFCMVYALAGIPLTLVLLSALVDRLLGPTSKILSWMTSRMSHLYQPFTIRLIHLTLVALVLGGLFLLVPAAIFAYLEPDWDYLDSFYYCFVSLTTIGLGDYIPGDSPDQPYRPLYKVLTTVYLFSGITFMMLTLTVFYDIPQLNLGALLTTDNVTTAEEKVRLAGSENTNENYNYGLQHERNVVKVRTRPRDDSPSPEEAAAHTRITP